MDPAESVSLAALGAETLRQGIQFLYAQAGEVLNRWRDREEAADDDPLPPAEQGRTGLEIDPAPMTIDFTLLEEMEPEIQALSAALEEYATGERDIDPAADASLLRVTDGLRLALEAVLGQRLTLRGEQRGPRADVDVRVDAERVKGYVAAIVADDLEGAKVRVSIKAKDVEGTVVGYTERGGLPPTDLFKGPMK